MGGLSEVESIFELVYDLWMDDAQAYLDWADFYHRHVDDGRSVLELACGTGNVTQLIAPSTKHYVASDISLAMLKQAQQKVPQHVKLQQLDMRDFKLDASFDAIICAADSINFNQDLPQLRQTMHCVAQHLKKGGFFVFDVHHPERLNMFKQAYIEVGQLNDLDYQYTLTSHGMMLVHEFHWYTGVYPQVESYQQRIFSEAELKVVFKPRHWELYVENENREPGFSFGEKWLICAKYKGGLTI